MSEIRNGVYRGRGLQAALGRAGTGKEQVAVQFQLMDADGVSGPTITWYGYFTDSTYERTVESLRHCGWAGDDLSDLSGIDTNEVSLVIENEEYEGKATPKVKWVNAPGGGLALKEQLSADEARSFAAQMKGRILAMKQGQPKKPAPGSARSRSGGVLSPEPPPYADSDIPF